MEQLDWECDFSQGPFDGVLLAFEGLFQMLRPLSPADPCLELGVFKDFHLLELRSDWALSHL